MAKYFGCSADDRDVQRVGVTAVVHQPNNTISDVRYDTKGYRDASGKVTAASCSDSAALRTVEAAAAK